jgi:hypothetical protein
MKRMDRTALAMSLLLLFPGCTTVRVAWGDYEPEIGRRSDIEKDVLKCENDNGRVRCLFAAPWHVGETTRSRLPVSRRDVRRYGFVVLGYDVCSVSERRGLVCVNAMTGQRAEAELATRMKGRTLFAWDNGLCVESGRSSDISQFECFYREGRGRQRVAFKVAEKHRTVSFESGGCVCSDGSGGFSGDEQTPIGAACFFRDSDVPAYSDYNDRRMDSLTRGVIMRGPIFSVDFGEVCRSLEGASAEKSVQLLNAWESGEVPLPAHVNASAIRDAKATVRGSSRSRSGSRGRTNTGSGM